MIDKIEMNTLLDYYGSLLTDKQQEICHLYYREDLSYQEISELLNITKAAVYDTVKRCNHELTRFEDLLHSVANANLRSQIYLSIQQHSNDEFVLQAVDKLMNTEVEGGYDE